MTPKQQLFVREYLVDLNATQAALRAGYSAKNAAKIASETLQKPEVAAAVKAAQEAQLKRVERTGEDVLRGLWRIADADLADAYYADGEKKGQLKPIHEIPKDLRLALAGLETIELPGDTGGVLKKLKVNERTKALELLAKHFELLTEKHKHELEGPGWAELAQAAAQKGGAK